jgi:hypothetical protein
MIAAWRRIVPNGYRSTALLLLNTLVLFVLLNVLLLALFWARDSLKAGSVTADSVTAKYGDSAVRQVYGQSDQAEVQQLLKETWSRPYVYEAYTQFKERPFVGQYVNVAEAGFRLSKPQAPWPPVSTNLNLFVFGGSTTFGYGVADDQTTASWLQHSLGERLRRPVAVYNFGRGYYYSTQERILYERLLTSGFVPDVAIFIDGLNDFYYYNDEPFFTEELQAFIRGDRPRESSEWAYLSKLPMARFARGVRQRLGILSPTSKDEDTAATIPIADRSATIDTAAVFPQRYDDHPLLNAVIDRYLRNKKIIEAASAAFSVEPVFAWQPVPTYGYDFRNYPFLAGGFYEHTYSRYGYRLMAKRSDTGAFGKNFLWCADIQQGIEAPLYVDKVHYSPLLSRLLAEKIAALMVEKGLLRNRGRL